MQSKDEARADKDRQEKDRAYLEADNQRIQKSKDMTKDAQANNFNQILVNQQAIMARESSKNRKSTRNSNVHAHTMD